LQDLPCVGFGLFSIREQAELLGGMLEVSSSPAREPARRSPFR